MSDEEIKNFINQQSQSRGRAQFRPVARRRAKPAQREEQDAFKDFSATHLFCPTCKMATPVRERILLYLSDGDLYDYSCVQCGTSVGTRKAGK